MMKMLQLGFYDSAVATTCERSSKTHFPLSHILQLSAARINKVINFSLHVHFQFSLVEHLNSFHPNGKYTHSKPEERRGFFRVKRWYFTYMFSLRCCSVLSHNMHAKRASNRLSRTRESESSWLGSHKILTRCPVKPHSTTFDIMLQLQAIGDLSRFTSSSNVGIYI